MDDHDFIHREPVTVAQCRQRCANPLPVCIRPPRPCAHPRLSAHQRLMVHEALAAARREQGVTTAMLHDLEALAADLRRRRIAAPQDLEITISHTQIDCLAEFAARLTAGDRSAEDEAPDDPAGEAEL